MQKRSFKDDWEVDWENPLGSGSYGTVFRASRVQNPGSKAALKVFVGDEIGRSEQRRELAAYAATQPICKNADLVCLIGDGSEYFDRWVKAEPGVPNPFVLISLEENSHDGHHWLTRRGQSELRRIGWDDFCATMVGGAKRLASVHELGWTLRDVKPDNMMISWRDRRCVFIDLNFACFVETCQRWTGTQPFMQPEALQLMEQNDPARSKRASATDVGRRLRYANDVWAFALSFAEFFTRKAFGTSVLALFPKPPLPASERLNPLSVEFLRLADGHPERFDRMRANLEDRFVRARLHENNAAFFAKEAIMDMLRFQIGNPELQLDAFRELKDANPKAYSDSTPVFRKRRRVEKATSSPRSDWDEIPTPRAGLSRTPSPRRASPSPGHIPTPRASSSSSRRASPLDIKSPHIPTPRASVSPRKSPKTRKRARKVSPRSPKRLKRRAGPSPYAR